MHVFGGGAGAAIARLDNFAFSHSDNTITASGGITPTTNSVHVVSDGGAVVVTANPQITAGTVESQFLMIQGTSNTDTVELNTGNGLHLHGGKAILKNNYSILFHWDTSDSLWHEVSRNFEKNDITIAFTSPAGSSGTFYFDGFYDLASTDNDFNPTINFGTANSAKGAHLFLVQAAGASGGTDTIIRVTGTSITDGGIRTAADTEDVTVDDAGAIGTYYETAKKWIGQISIVVFSGPDILCNYGFCKYWDNNNTNFQLSGVNATWLSGANDSGANILIRHHKATGWTYNSGAAPTPPLAVVDMQTDYNTEVNLVNGENGSWKRDDLIENISGSSSEGIIIEFLTTANKAFEMGNVILTIIPN